MPGLQPFWHRQVFPVAATNYDAKSLAFGL
jgi:hypothetical protein